MVDTKHGIENAIERHLNVTRFDAFPKKAKNFVSNAGLGIDNFQRNVLFKCCCAWGEICDDIKTH